MTVICDECNMKMPTQKILDLHKVKRHGTGKKGEETVIRPEEAKAPVVEAVLESKPVESGMVEIHSADGRELEVSVGSNTWRGTTITFPKVMQFTDKDGNVSDIEMEEEIRRLLKDGGFYVKN